MPDVLLKYVLFWIRSWLKYNRLLGKIPKALLKLNNCRVIENIGFICGVKLEELPYWETINNYLKRLDPEEMQGVVTGLVKHLIRSRVFEKEKIRGKYWQILIDGTQLESSRKELDPNCLYRTHKKGTEEEYKEYYYYVLEAKLVLTPDIVVSVMTEFVENSGEEMKKQDCELKACYRLMDRLKKTFPCLKICICGDSLYAGKPFIEKCEAYGWKYVVRFKKGSIPYIYEEYENLKNREGNEGNKGKETSGKKEIQWNHVSEIDYEGHKVNYAWLMEEENGKKKEFSYITNLRIKKKGGKEIVTYGRRRWKIENEGFNTQKNQGYHLEHMYSRDYQGMKNHYYLIQTGHMIAQILESWKKVWEGTRQSREQKHRRLLENWKTIRIRNHKTELEKRYQIRLE